MTSFALTAPDQPAALVDLPNPEVGPDAIRVRIRAASINGFDVFQASGALMGMMEHDLPTTIGRDFSGIVEAVGSARTDVAIGDEVLGFVPSAPPLHDGTFTHHMTTANVVVARKPEAMSFEAAAALPLAGATALDAVDAVDPQPGDIVLVSGATGGVGHLAVQLAAQRGATVIATARPGQEEFVLALGASAAIDWTRGDVVGSVRAMHPDGVSAVIDSANRAETFGALAGVLQDGGRIASTLGGADVEALAAQGFTATNVMAQPTSEKLSQIAQSAAAGTLRVALQRTFPLAGVADALRAFAAGTLGKLVLTVE